MSDQPPEELFIGMVRGEWPVAAFPVDSPSLAIHWLKEAEANRPRRLWRVTVADVVEQEYVEPRPYLQDKARKADG